MEEFLGPPPLEPRPSAAGPQPTLESPCVPSLTYASCGGRVKIIGAIEDSLAIKQTLEFMRSQEKAAHSWRNLLSLPERAPPADFFEFKYKFFN